MSVRYLGTNSPDGTSLGKDTTEKISFYGKTPIVQQSGADQAAVRTTDLVTTGALDTNSTVHKQIAKDINELRAFANQVRSDLVTLGLIKGAA